MKFISTFVFNYLMESNLMVKLKWAVFVHCMGPEIGKLKGGRGGLLGSG